MAETVIVPVAATVETPYTESLLPDPYHAEPIPDMT